MTGFFPSAAHPRFQRLMICLLLVGITLTAYWPVRRFGFVSFDDFQYVWDNPRIASGLTIDNIRWSFTTFQTNNYHPLTWISYLLDASLFSAKPQGIHIENVLLHTTNALLLFAFLRRSTGTLWPSAAVAALFAVHPTHVESVAWISERKDVLSTFFFLLALLKYVAFSKNDHHRRWFAYAWSLLFFSMGLLSKSMLVTFPFVLLLIDYWPLDRLRRNTVIKLLIEKIPFFILSIAASAATSAAQASISASLDKIPLSLRVQNALLSYWGYLAETFWPTNLCLLYPYRWNISTAAWIGALLLLIGCTIVIVISRRRYAVVGWLWFLGTLVPVIGIVQVGAQSMADRYLYIPSIGLYVLIVWSLRRLGALSSAILASIVIVALIILTRHQVGYWVDSDHLSSRISVVLNGSAGEEIRQGELASACGDIASAESHFRSALSLDPSNYAADFDLGNVLLKQNPGLAIEHYKSAASKQPNDARVQINWGVALLRLNDPAGAFTHFRNAELLDADSYDAHYNLGQLFLSAGKPAQARTEFESALRIKPGDARAEIGLHASAAH